MAVRQGIHKSRGGLIRARVSETNGRIEEVTLSGDFFMYPEDAVCSLEKGLRGVELSEERIRRALADAYAALGIQSPGTSYEDFAIAIMKAVG
ncbi:MAG TPA: lipoate--protein ligase family protein [Candidatus Methanoperedenaceae archaeon]|nr:lipoate--protein ligase family protein [Candidatus Methanoperedenaceae archaeon]